MHNCCTPDAQLKWAGFSLYVPSMALFFSLCAFMVQHIAKHILAR